MKEINDNSISLNKFISSTGVCSRREADKLIEAKNVTINGKIAALGNRVFEGDQVKVKGRYLRPKPKTIYIAFNKPVGLVCTTDLKESDNIISYINHPKRLFPIGRLDKPSEGLIFLTNDGDIVNKILRAGNNHEKEYVVTVDRKISDDFLDKMRNGIPILGTVTKKCRVDLLNNYTFKIILTQGLNRQIRRMCEYLNYKVTKLKRTRIMNVQLSRLKKGEWRELKDSEMNQINEMLEASSMTEDASTDLNRKSKFKPSKKSYRSKSKFKFNRNKKK